MIRADLLALTPDGLAALANRGLVKRAAKDLDAGIVPELTLDADGALHGRFPDGVQAVLPREGGFESARCTCAAPGACRHRVALALAYQRQTGAAQDGSASPAQPMSPELSPGPGSAIDASLKADAAGSPATAEAGAAGDEQGATGSAGSDGEAKSAAGLGSGGEAVAAGDGRGAWTEWSPGEFDDDLLVRALGQRAVDAARRTHRAGYSARIRRPTADDPSALVELPACTVRFLVPGELGYVHTDVGAVRRGEVVTLAVWACRVADARGLRGTDIRVDVGGDVGGDAGGEARGKAARGAGMSGLEDVLGLVDQVLIDGAAHAGPVLVTSLRRACRELGAARLLWPADALDDLAAQLTAYRERAAAYAPERLAALVAETHARHRAALHPGGTPRSQVLGTGEQAETPLRQVRLTALGCRIGGTDGERTAEIYFAQPAAGIVLVLRRRWEVGERESPTGHELADRRLSGSTLAALATANVVSENASRTAGRAVRMSRGGRLSKTSITPVGAAWRDLPAPLLVRDLKTLDREVAALPPRAIRPRVRAERVHVIEAAEVGDVTYDPAAQRLTATIADVAGTTALLDAVYSPYCPGALDRLAETLAAPREGPLHLSAAVRRARGGLVLDPIAVMSGGEVVVPDLAPGAGDTDLAAGAGREEDPLTAVIGHALTACAEIAHRGLRHVTPATRARLAESARGLRASGLRTAATLLDDLAGTLGAAAPEQAVARWVDAHLHLAAAAELR